MPAYIFYPYLAGGSGLTFEAVELTDDAAAMAQAVKVLAAHSSAAEVEIWRDDELIHRQRREAGPLGDSGLRPRLSADGRSESC
ncbi:hypothetical protein [Phenylobacterium sp.]|uniref:hypothetical protein n=1 Tax=Phenylobacterium sp. TaxID=1871053 RepID=UPI00286DCF44|nr:hypothetical protein [Phenylobacterium sp.]